MERMVQVAGVAVALGLALALINKLRKAVGEEEGASEAAARYRSKHPERPDLYYRRWRDFADEAVLKNRPADASTVAITFMQFNTLADGLAARDKERRGGFTECPLEALEWKEYRCDRVMEEILRHGSYPDVVALEEVDHYYDDLLPAMAALGYRGLYKTKPDSKCKQQSGDDSLEDGCALFWRKDKFEETGSAEEGAVAVWYVSYEKADADGKLLGEKANQVAILAELRPKGCAGTVIVGCTHLMAKKKAEGERGRKHQIKQLLDLTMEKQREAAANNVVGLTSLPPVLLGMDMNAAPQEQSHKYDAEALPAALAHPLGLRSAYAVACGGQEPAWSTWKKRGESEAKHTIDYILASPDVEVRRVLLAPDEATVEAGRLPCFKYPSDHIAIAAEFNVPV
jgi:nocturnin